MAAKLSTPLSIHLSDSGKRKGAKCDRKAKICKFIPTHHISRDSDNAVLKLSWGLCLCLISFLAACEHLPDEAGGSHPASIRGITLVDWSPNGYTRATSDSALRAIASIGATHVTVIVTAYQSSQTSDRVQIDSTRTPTQQKTPK